MASCRIKEAREAKMESEPASPLKIRTSRRKSEQQNEMSDHGHGNIFSIMAAVLSCK
jgi:hypothetical protein